MNIFKEVKMKSVDSKLKINKVEWGDPAEVAFHLQKMRLEDRLSLLNQIVPKRICPICECIKINTSSWVVSKDHTKAICRSCFQRKLPDKDLDKSSKLDCKLFAGMKIRYVLSHSEITRARFIIRISANEFARQAGWTATYQYKLEDGSVKSITSEVAETILEVFLRFGYYTTDEL